MGGARALIASLGASISLMAGAALSLLIVSFVFAYPGITDGITAQSPPTAFALPESAQVASARGAQPQPETAPVALKATPAASSQPAKRAPRAPRPPRIDPAPVQPAFNPRVPDLTPAPSPSATPKPAGRAPATGDTVREAGDAVTATVQQTGDSVRDVTSQLLGPPVGKAVQDVLDLLTAIVQGATDGLAGLLDKAVPRR